jgi:diguanylate cyclase (GGDEF)-like protein
MTNDLDTCPNCQLLRDQLAAQALRIQELEALMQNLARHDSLTGAYSLRVMQEFLTAELQRSMRTGSPFCFAIIDLDDFNQINETWGREAGDRVLAMVAESSGKVLRVLDRFARIGDDEFGIMLPVSWLEQGAQAINRLTEALGACDWESVTPGHKLRFSCGLTTNAPADSTEKIFARAEKALHQAKQAGKNRTVQMEEALPDMLLDGDF